MALAFVALTLIRRWVTDTSAERGRLATAETAAHDEHARYIAGLAALDAERIRVRRDATVAAGRQRAQLTAERERMDNALEAKRAEISAEAFRTGALMERAGLLTEPEPASVTHLFPARLRPADADAGISHPV
jgi:hypothetical protein